MPDFLFLLSVSALVIANLATRIAVSRGYFGGLPPLPREQ